MIGNILDNTTEFYMIKYTFGEIFSSGGATLFKNPSDQTVMGCFPNTIPLQIEPSLPCLVNDWFNPCCRWSLRHPTQPLLRVTELSL